MATVIPPPSKKQKKLDQLAKVTDVIPDNLPEITINFKSSDPNESKNLPPIRIPGSTNLKQLDLLLNKLLSSSDDPTPYSFNLLLNSHIDKDGDEIIDSHPIKSDIYNSILKPKLKSSEEVFTLIYTPQAIFKVKPITRCSSTMNGHQGTILSIAFAPFSSSRLVSGSGDSTARIWDSDTSTPMHILKGHKNWILCVSWSPDGTIIATGSMDNTIILWDAKTAKPLGSPLTGHSKWISSLAWEPLHLVPDDKQSRLASSSKDGTVRIWDTTLRQCLFTLSAHSSAVSCVKWGGLNTVYSTSHDKTIKLWDPNTGRLKSTLSSHAHWVNHIALSTDFLLRTGPYSPPDPSSSSSSSSFSTTFSSPNSLYNASPKVKRAIAKDRFEKGAKINGVITELVVTASDDFTMFLWNPIKSTKPVARLIGHGKLVNHVAFSPDFRMIASASFDNSIKIWDARTGKYISTLRGHVGAVYMVAWSSDSRLLVSASKDTTCKVWDMRTNKLFIDLPGHLDEVYAIDWSLDGEKVASGGKDKSIKLWRH